MQRILVIEDEMQIARTLRDYLEVAGFEVTVVGDEHRGFFPGFFLFPLFLIGAFFLIGGIMRGAGRWGRGGPGGYGPGPWNEEGRRRFEERAREWHQREHGDTPPAEASPAG